MNKVLSYASAYSQLLNSATPQIALLTLDVITAEAAIAQAIHFCNSSTTDLFRTIGRDMLTHWGEKWTLATHKIQTWNFVKRHDPVMQEVRSTRGTILTHTSEIFTPTHTLGPSVLLTHTAEVFSPSGLLTHTSEIFTPNQYLNSYSNVFFPDM